MLISDSQHFEDLGKKESICELDTRVKMRILRYEAKINSIDGFCTFVFGDNINTIKDSNL